MIVLDIRYAGTRWLVPSPSGIEELDELTAAHQRLTAELLEEEERGRRLAGELAEARAAVLDERARARIAGKALPKESKSVANIEAKIETSEETAGEITRALQVLGGQIGAMIERKASDWVARFDTELVDEREEWRAALEPVRARLENLRHAVDRSRWAHAAANRETFKPGGALVVDGLERRDGSRYGVDLVLDELEHLGEPQERPVRKSMDELEAERLERVRAANEREEALAARAAEIHKTLPQPRL